MQLPPQTACLDQFLIDPSAELWSADFRLDPICTALDDSLISATLQIDLNDVEALVALGVLQRTCLVSVVGNFRCYYSNYWDVMQAAIARSLLSLGETVENSVFVSEVLCDMLAYLYEMDHLSTHVHILALAEHIRNEFPWELKEFNQVLERHSEEAISLKISIDILNAHASLMNAAREQQTFQLIYN